MAQQAGRTPKKRIILNKPEINKRQENTPSSKTWYAVYTQPRWEKKVAEMLTKRGIENYCPLNKVYRKWSDRMKMVELPLFSSYVFVHINLQKEQLEIRKTPGVLNFVYWLGKPAVIKDAEITVIRRFLNEYENVEAIPAGEAILPGSKVVVTGGLMMGEAAEVLDLDNKMAEVLIESIGFRLRAKIPVKKLEIRR